MLLIAVALSTVTPSDRWVYLGGRTGLYEEYLDKASVERTGNKVTLWTRRDFVRGRGTSWNELELDCSARTDTILAYVEDDAGIISHNVARPHRKASAIPPNSVEERIFNIVCR